MLSPGVPHRTVPSLFWRGALPNARDQALAALTSPWCSHIVPTVIAVGGDDKTSTITKKGRIDDLDFYIGDEAIQQKTQALMQAAMKLGEAMYAQQEGGAGEGEDANAGDGESEDVVDAEFTEVKDDDDGDEKKSA